MSDQENNQASPEAPEITPAPAIPDTLSIMDVDGNGRTVRMKLPWGRERKMLKIIGDLFSQIPSELTFGVASSDNPGLALLKYLTMEAPEKITEIVALLLDVKVEVVDEKYDGDEVINFAIPFVTHYAAKWGERLKGLPIGDLLGGVPGPVNG